MRQVMTLSRFAVAFGLAWGITMFPVPANALYQLLTTIPVPPSTANPFPGGPFTTYDISFFDDSTQIDYVADRTNASVDLFSAQTNSFIGRVPGFAGIQPPPPATANSALSGPNGVLVVNQPGQHQLWAGDANSILKGYDLGTANPPALPPPQIASIATGAPTDNRANEMAFDPTDKLLMVTNNAPGVPPGSQPAFVSIINTTTNAIVAKTVFDGTVQHGAPTPNATGATEQPAWIGGSIQKFFVSLPQVNGTGPGGIVQLDITGKVTHFYDFATFGISACSPSGLVVGQNNVLGVNCQTAGSQVILFDPNANGGNGAVVKTFSQFSAGDEAWFDPATGYFFFAENNNLGGPVLGIIDGNTDTFLQSIPTSGGAHSVAVDPVSGEVFVPEGGAPVIANSACPQGCIAVFANVAAVPEPASLSLILTAFTGLAGVAWRRRRQ